MYGAVQCRSVMNSSSSEWETHHTFHVRYWMTIVPLFSSHLAFRFTKLGSNLAPSLFPPSLSFSFHLGGFFFLKSEVCCVRKWLELPPEYRALYYQISDSQPFSLFVCIYGDHVRYQQSESVYYAFLFLFLACYCAHHLALRHILVPEVQAPFTKRPRRYLG